MKGTFIISGWSPVGQVEADQFSPCSEGSDVSCRLNLQTFAEVYGQVPNS